MSTSRPLLVTAFGPFGGRRVNASSLALRQLRRDDPSLRTRVLPVDLVEAPRRLHDAIRRLSPRAVLMLGEAAGADRLRLETHAWNELDFAIPDIAGRQPRAKPIEAGAPVRLSTSLDGETLRRQLARAGHAVRLSQDPGRYLCNRVYFGALLRAGVPSLFAHLPLERTLPTAKAVEALRLVIRAL